MTNEQILIKAIEKAVKNGWNYKIVGFNYYAKCLLDHPYTAQGFIFSHDFAKAFWGRSKTDAVSFDKYFHAVVDITGEEAFLGYSGELWQYCLQQMVLEEDPIKYLEKFL